MKLESTALQGVHILFVEDDEPTREALAFWLQLYGADVVATRNAEEALKAFDARTPDLLISDIGLPGVDGFELLRRIRRQPAGREVPAAAVTAFTSPEDRRQAHEAGYQVHFPKPVEPYRFVEMTVRLARESSAGH